MSSSSSSHQNEIKFLSRRSPVYSTHGMVASSQPLASQIGLQILEKGGNAADACVAMAAALSLTEPMSTGLGGDCFALFYDATTKKVEGLNGSGRSPQNLSFEKAKEHEEKSVDGGLSIKPDSVHSVTVPGCAAGWCDTLEKWGRLSLKQVLSPTIQLAEDGFPVSPISAYLWAKAQNKLGPGDNGKELLLDGKAPVPGQVFKNPHLANTLTTLAESGKEGFYQGAVADAIVKVIKESGGVLDHKDLLDHVSTFPDPISVNYHGVDVWEIPPNGQGLTALLALNILEELNVSQYEHNSADYLHILIEATRLAFADTRWYIADSDKVKVPVKELLSKEYATERRKFLDLKKATADIKRGSPTASCDTCSFIAVDKEGNACSFINSTYMSFGVGLVPKGTGFALQNRGANFSLEPDHPNIFAPGKRPYHTIIPGMATKNGELFCPFSVMGGFNQPQGHVQVIINLVDFKFDPQLSLDFPRYCIENGVAGGHVLLEDGIPVSVIQELKARGHDARGPVIGHARNVFGRGQIIHKQVADEHTQVLTAGSDGRGDGCALGLVNTPQKPKRTARKRKQPATSSEPKKGTGKKKGKTKGKGNKKQKK